MESLLRTIVRSNRYGEELTRIFSGFPEADEAVAALEWTLCRIAEYGMSMPGFPGYLTWPLHTPRGSYRVLYRLGDHEVICLSIRRLPDLEEEDH